MDVEIRTTALAYEAYLGGTRVGELAFSKTDSVVTLLHTEVFPEAEGKGVGSALVRAAADEARTNGWQIIATCPFAASWFDRHPDEADVRVG